MPGEVVSTGDAVDLLERTTDPRHGRQITVLAGAQGLFARCLGSSGIPLDIGKSGQRWRAAWVRLGQPAEAELGLPLVAGRTSAAMAEAGPMSHLLGWLAERLLRDTSSP